MPNTKTRNLKILRMIEKIGFVKNPLTVIAIFAGIAEVSGTVVLPFVEKENQIIFIWFLMIFPIMLVIAFFLTLNFNHRVLYAPSDYKDEDNFLKLTRFDTVKQKYVQIDLDKNETYKFILSEIESIKESLKTRIEKTKITTQFEDEQSEDATSDKTSTDITPTILHKGRDFSFQVRNFQNVNVFIERMKNLGYTFKIYEPQNSKIDFVQNINTGRAIWLGSNIPFDFAKEVILQSKKIYPQLQYILITGELNDESPYESNNEIFIGGSTESAVKMFKLKPLTEEQFEEIGSCETLNELHQIIRQSYPQY